MQRDRYAWITIVPTVWIGCTTLTAAWQKIFDDNPRIGFLSHATSYKEALSAGNLLAPAQSVSQMQQVIFNAYLDAGLAAMFMCILISMLFFCLRTVRLICRSERV
jgi:carbon starvation protein